MLTKFETKSNRVKGLSFHSKRPWILASLHSGVIQLWDYRMGRLIDRFEGHDGPVRGVQFHKSQPLFVSGGDDYKIKVWNYKLHRCLFTLLGHLDYIRTVQFHSECPWIISASDDQTIRIWNWQSRTCISVLTGHNHYVMCASFHPKEDLVVSASLDQTVRVWDISGLRKKSFAPSEDVRRIGQINTDFFGGVDVVVKYVLEGHDRGVNWASFHPTLPLIVSGADDRHVKLWRMNETKAWEVDTLRGHMNNVSCVMYHTRQDIIVSNSEDKSFRVWDATKRTAIQTFRREHDRFWILAVHPEINLLAAGHDSGMIVFKLERERPAFCSSNDVLYYVKDRFLRLYDYPTQRDTQVMPIRRPGSVGLNQGATTLSYSPTENAILIFADSDGGSYELHIINKDGTSRLDSFQEAKRGNGASAAVFVARNRFAVLEKSGNQITVKNLKNEVVKKSAIPIVATAIFYGGTGNLLCKAEDKVILFDLQQRLVVGELQAPFVRYVIWSSDMESIALLSKHCVIIVDNRLVHRCTLHETVRVKSGAWDQNGVFIYTTLNHIKYCLPNGDSGIIRTIEVPVYITKVDGNTIYCLDQDGRNRVIAVDATEYTFKLFLLKQRYEKVMSMIRASNLCGQAMISYLQQKGFPGVAIHLVKDEKTRFNLALDSGNIEIAVASAKELDRKDHWYKLGVEALQQGNAGIVEYAYQKTKNFERLSFLYLVTGNIRKLSKMLKIAQVENDVMGQFHNALYLGDVRERIAILESAGHLSLAYVTATTHGLHDIAERLAAELGANVPSLPKRRDSSSLLMPPAPIVCGGDWPLLRVTKGVFEGGLDNMGKTEEEDEENAADVDWGEVLDIEDAENINTLVLDGEEEHDGTDEGGWDLEDLNLPPETDIDTHHASGSHSSQFIAPTPGLPLNQIWSQSSSLAAEHVVAGNCDTAMRLLARQLGIRNFTPLRPFFAHLQMGSHAYLHACASAPGISSALQKEQGDDDPVKPKKRGSPPALLFQFPQLEDKLEAAYQATTAGKLADALQLFLTVLHMIPLVVVDTRREVDEMKELIMIAREYVLGLKLGLKQRETKDDPARKLELAALFTHCGLKTPHLRLALRSAMVACYNANNFSFAASFARRLLKTKPTIEKQAISARQTLSVAERNNMSDAVELNYDFRVPFVVCGATFVPIYRGQRSVACPYCSAQFVPAQDGQICSICDLAMVGADASGLLCSASQMR